MLKENMLNALNKQINEELYSAYLYLAMSADFLAKGLSGTANWFQVQAQEEVGHAMKIYGYINERGGKVELQAIKEPAKEWESLQKAFEDALKHEQYISSCINKLVDLAIELKDHATGAFLQWFVNEQVEEEASVEEVLNKVKLIGGQGNVIYMLDKELGSRGSN